MRIQHNIMSMNAYRNYNNNASALSKNLEKLSSGYKINRAGDDAAGLAISEKMRAQIKGLDAATKNVKDGISLVKTAEGAMQEIQDMLSRMKYLATQSANGTYDDDVDRKALQNEVDQLNSEINRIADSANFNGTKLLDGSLAGSGSGSKTTAVAKPSVEGFTLTENKGSKAKATLTFAAATAGLDGLTVSVSVNGKNYEYKFDAVATKSGTKFELKNGEDTLGTAGNFDTGHNLNVVKTGAKVTAAEVVEAIKDKLQADLGSDFTVSGNGADLTIEAAKEGADTITGVSGSLKYTTQTDPTAPVGKIEVATLKGQKEGKDTTYSVAVATAFKLSTKADKLNVFSLNGTKFVFMDGTSTKVAEEMNKITDSSINVINIKSIAATKADEIAAQLNKLTGMNITAKADGTLVFAGAKGGSNAGGGLQLQIGDTGDNYNQLSVVVKDLHAAAIGCAGVDISSIGGAQAAIDTVKDCINYVSEIRGTLGATQNRLEHTQNNLSVMKENIQDAESTIRDTDVADEMMAYTKNNILIQSAQAMLAQANAVPQGVLQLLQ